MLILLVLKLVVDVYFNFFIFNNIIVFDFFFNVIIGNLSIDIRMVKID